MRLGSCGKATAAVALTELTAQQAVLQRRAGDGERKQVTVQFADLEGSAEALGTNRRIEEALAVLDDTERGALKRGTLVHSWKARAQLAQAAGDLVEEEIQYRRSLVQARQLSKAPVCGACEAALAALAALQPGSSVERNVEV